MEPVKQREQAVRRVESAARELRDAQFALGELKEPDALELEAIALVQDDRPRLRLIDGGESVVAPPT